MNQGNNGCGRRQKTEPSPCATLQLLIQETQRRWNDHLAETESHRAELVSVVQTLRDDIVEAHLINAKQQAQLEEYSKQIPRLFCLVDETKELVQKVSEAVAVGRGKFAVIGSVMTLIVAPVIVTMVTNWFSGGK